MALLDLSNAPHGGQQRHLPEWESQPKITPTTIIDHSIVGSGRIGYELFRDRSVLESHFIVCGAGDLVDGEIWQLMDTDREAHANLDGNRYAISIETGDQGDPDRQPWTQAQLESLAWLHEQLIQTHPTIPRRESSSCTLPGGLGFHTMHGAPSCWTPVAKTCPGTIRKTQWREVLLPAFLAGQPILEADMPLTADDITNIRAAVQAELEEFRSRRPANLSSDPTNKPLTLGELVGVFPSAGVPGLRREVEEIQATLAAGLQVGLTADQLQQLAETLAPLVADLLAAVPHPPLDIVGVAAPPVPEPTG